MSVRMQGTVLRFLETGEIQPIGSEHLGRHVDVRVVAATNCNLDDHVTSRAFRLDLYYRLNVIHLHIPPLNKRVDDIPLLLEHFLDMSQPAVPDPGQRRVQRGARVPHAGTPGPETSGN